MGFGEQMSYISTSDGALLEFMEGKVLPSVAALRYRLFKTNQAPAAQAAGAWFVVAIPGASASGAGMFRRW